MAKIALLIGVSEYGAGLKPLPSSLNDVDAIQRVLTHPEMGGFAEADLSMLKNPERQEMTEAIEDLFAARHKDDLVLLYFSGHGVKDDRGELFLTTTITRKNEQGNLVRSTAMAANFLHQSMNQSRSKRQVIILDCCYSGAIARGMTVKDDEGVDLQKYLGGKGRAILTSSTSTEYSFSSELLESSETSSAETGGLSIYTRYLVEGIATGAADADDDGWIAVDELHQYAAVQVAETAPTMTPKFYPVEEGYKIILARSPQNDPKLKYRKEVQSRVKQAQGKLSLFAQRLLAEKRADWGLSLEEVETIETEVLQPYRDYERKLQKYEGALEEAAKIEYPFSKLAQQDLQEYQQYLELRNSDIFEIHERVLTPLKQELERQQQIPIQIECKVDCRVQHYLNLISVDNTLQMLLKDDRQYKSEKSPNLQDWAKSTLNKIIKPLLLGKRYIDILTDFSKEAEKIQEELQHDAESIGYRIEHIISIPRLEHSKLKETFKLVVRNEKYSINAASIAVALEAKIAVKFETFDRLAMIFSQGKTADEILVLMRITVDDFIGEILRTIDLERFYMRFYEPEKDEKGYSLEKSVQQELKETIQTLLEDCFGAKVEKIVPVPIQTDIVHHLQRLMGMIGTFTFQALSPTQSKCIQFQGDFKIHGIEPGNWHTFQYSFQFMRHSQEQLLEELWALKEQYSRLINSGDVIDNREELQEIIKRIREIEDKTCGINDIKKSIERSINAKLMTTDNEFLRYPDIQLLSTMERHINQWARESVIEQYGLKVSIRHLSCIRTKELQRQLKIDSRRDESRQKELDKLYELRTQLIADADVAADEREYLNKQIERLEQEALTPSLEDLNLLEPKRLQGKHVLPEETEDPKQNVRDADGEVNGDV